eukprot:1157609-Pelagomonas_calceolata.AAC.1
MTCLVFNLWPSSAVALFPSMMWVRLPLSNGKRFVGLIFMRGQARSSSMMLALPLTQEALLNSQHMVQLLGEEVGVLMIWFMPEKAT